MRQARMVRLATLASSFHARVIAARLGAEGIPVQLRGNVDGLYPFGDVHLFVDEVDLPSAQEILLVDEVESAFDDDEPPPGAGARHLWMVTALVLLMVAVAMVRAA